MLDFFQSGRDVKMKEALNLWSNCKIKFKVNKTKNPNCVGYHGLATHRQEYMLGSDCKDMIRSLSNMGEGQEVALFHVNSSFPYSQVRFFLSQLAGLPHSSPKYNALAGCFLPQQ